ncbi:hypothetical protein D0867_04740 [Hortaea werneckii]|uniref:Uncharacterized protein n=1 Tax=Hortaea werneckii TaxID=91943 RepID=A0A3M6ZVL0_HORWE|nr:hypothetical protein D0867_04740 [Hortaea werneckii]RMY36168.1 hypothetical protein D0866_04121 [Hortaea werneckii]
MSLPFRLQEQDVVEVKNALEANELLRRDLSDAQAACERLEKSNSSLRNARAMQKARLGTLEHENANLKNINMDSEQKYVRIKALQRDCHQLQELNTSLQDEHTVKVSKLKRGRIVLKNENAKLEDDKVALDKKLRDADARVIGARNAAKTADGEIVRLRRELEGEKRKTMEWEGKVQDLHQQLGNITKLETELTNKTDRLATAEEQVSKLRKELETAAEEQDAHVAALRRTSELESALNGLRTLFSDERAFSQKVFNEAKDSTEHLKRIKTQCLALEEAVQAREISIHEQDTNDFQRKQAKQEGSEQREHQRQYLSTIGSLERERNKLGRELADLEHDHQSLQDYSRKLEGDLKTLSSTTKQALEKNTEQLHGAKNEKVTCDRIIKQLTEQANDREIYVDRLRQALATKRVRKRYIGTEKLTQAESDLYFDASDCCKSSPAFEVRVHGCLLLSGFSVSTAAIISSDPRSLGFLEEAHRIEAEDFQVLRNVPWVLTKHGSIEEAIQQWKEHEAAMQQEAEQKKPGDPSQCGQENYAISVKSRESTRLSLQGWKAHTGLVEVAREAESEPTGKPHASTQHLPAALNPSERRCEAESIVSRPEITLSNPNSPISPREPTASVTLPHNSRPAASAAQYTVGGDIAQPSPRELFPHPRSRQASRDELGYGQVSRDPRNAQKRPRSDEKNGLTDNRPPWNAPKRPRFLGYSRT